MKVLVVTTQYPFPPKVGSSIVAYNAIKYLAANNSLDLVCFKPSEEKISEPEFVNKTALVGQEKSSGYFSAIRYILNMFSGIPPSVTSLESKAMNDKVEELIKSNEYEAILLFEMSTLQYCPSSCYNKVAMNVEDPPSLKLSRMAELPIYSLFQRFKYFLASRLTAAYENKYFPKVAKVILLSEKDIEEMNIGHKFNNLEYVPYGVDKRDDIEILNFAQRDKTIIFSGNMYYPPNVDGVLNFLNNVFPLVLKVYPSVILQIVGSNPDKKIFSAAKKFGSSVLITGRVADIASYIKKAAVSVCTIRLKIGVQTKILESLSYGTPIVSNVSSNSGINGLNGIHLWSEDKPEIFAERVAELLNGNGWEKLSKAGRLLTINNFSWENSGMKLEQVLRDILKK